VLTSLKQIKDNVPETGEISLVIHFHVNNFEELTAENALRLKRWVKSFKEMNNSLEVQVGNEESQSKID